MCARAEPARPGSLSWKCPQAAVQVAQEVEGRRKATTGAAGRGKGSTPSGSLWASIPKPGPAPPWSTDRTGSCIVTIRAQGYVKSTADGADENGTSVAHPSSPGTQTTLRANERAGIRAALCSRQLCGLSLKTSFSSACQRPLPKWQEQGIPSRLLAIALLAASGPQRSRPGPGPPARHQQTRGRRGGA